MTLSASLRQGSRWDFLPHHKQLCPETINIGVIGCGPRAWYNAIPKFQQFAEYELIALCDIRQGLADRMAANIKTEYDKTVPTYSDYRKMIRSHGLDAVIVLVDADKQASIICECLEMGLHIMAEVPLCYSIEDCWHIVTSVERTGRTFLLMEQLRYAGYARAWRQIVRSGILGDIVLAEGEYFHNLPLRLYQNDDGIYHTREAAGEEANEMATWRVQQPPLVYLPHDLSPVLFALEDRVTRVTGMQSTANSKDQDEEFTLPGMQMALMQTEKGAVLRMATSFSTATPERHWQHIKGTDGFVEGPRNASSTYSMWVDGWQLPAALEMPWSLTRTDAPEAAVGSGHGDCDFYVFAAFADAVLRGDPLEFDIYRAVETAAPAILAATSIKQDNLAIDVPDFRPNPHRKAGEYPAEYKGLETQ